MKEIYESPMIAIISFESSDIITASPALPEDEDLGEWDLRTVQQKPPTDVGGFCEFWV